MPSRPAAPPARSLPRAPTLLPRASSGRKPPRPARVLGLALAAAVAAGALHLAAPSARAEDGPASREAKEAEALAAKEAAALVERMKASDLDVKHPAVAEAKSVQHPTVTAQLARAISDPDELTRLAALEGLAARTTAEGRKAAATAIAARLPRLTEAPKLRDELLRAIAVLHDLAQPVALKALAAHLGLDVEPEELAARLRAIANLPTHEAIETIIDFRATGGNRGGRSELGYRRRLAREAFTYATGTDAGQDPDAMRAWWKEHEKGFDYAAAAAARAKKGGGPKAKPGDGSSPDTGAKPGEGTPKPPGK